MAAGLQFKNRITSKDPDIKLQYQRMWLSFPEQQRLEIKALVSNMQYKTLTGYTYRYYKL